VVKLKSYAEELAALAQSVPPNVDHTANGILSMHFGVEAQTNREAGQTAAESTDRSYVHSKEPSARGQMAPCSENLENKFQLELNSARRTECIHA
jgi:hypothetical protein